MDYKALQELPEPILDYMNYISAVKNMAKTTIDEYYLDLRLFFRYMKVLKKGANIDEIDKIDIKDVDADFISKITTKDILSYFAYCKNERGLTAKSRARKATSLRQYFKYITDRTHLIDENPAAQLDSPKYGKSLPKYFTLEQALKLLSAIDGTYKVRDYAIVTIFLNCGLRLSELCGINLKDINFENNTLQVTGKGSKQRVVYLNEAAMSALKAYLAVRPNDGIRDREALFISRNNNRISPKTVQFMFNKLLDKSGLGSKNYSVHKLRHTAATLMYQHGGVDVLVLKEFLGHENLNTTEIYTHLTDKQLKEAADKNPLAHIKK